MQGGPTGVAAFRGSRWLDVTDHQPRGRWSRCRPLLWYVCRPARRPSLPVDLLVEGAYTRLMMAKPATGGDLVSAVWAFIMVGALGASGLVGVVSRGDAALFWWVATPFAAQVLLPVAAGWVGEPRVGRRDQRRGRALVRGHREVFGVGALVAGGALGLAAASLWARPPVAAAVSISTSVAVCGVSLWALPPVMGTSRSVLGGGVVLVGRHCWRGEGGGAGAWQGRAAIRE